MYHSVVVLCCFQLFFFHVTSVMYSPFLNWQKSYDRLCIILRVWIITITKLSRNLKIINAVMNVAEYKVH